MAAQDERDFNPDDLYDQFPSGAEHGFGPAEGYNTWLRVNDESLFTDEARKNPLIRAFLDAPFTVSFSQWKSSYRETEYFIHKPLDTMTGHVRGIEGRVEGLAEEPRISTLVMNHEHTLAKWVTRSVLLTDSTDCAQVVHKEPEPNEG